MTRFAPGTLIDGRYEVLDVAGAGASGVVYKARQTLTGALAAVKVLHLHSMEVQERGETILREAEALRRISHDAVVRYRDTFKLQDGSLALVTDFVEGENLERVIESSEPEPEHVHALAVRLLSGLGAVHKAGILHKDLSPKNIIVPNGDPSEAVIIDFGIARGEIDQFRTPSESEIGTLAFMAPEQLLGKSGPQGDIYSAGLLLLSYAHGRLITGAEIRDPDDRTKLSALLGMVEEIAPPLAAMLQESPKLRVQSAAAALVMWQALPLGAATPYDPVPQPEPARVADDLNTRQPDAREDSGESFELPPVDLDDAEPPQRRRDRKRAKKRPTFDLDLAQLVPYAGGLALLGLVLGAVWLVAPVMDSFWKPEASTAAGGAAAPSSQPQGSGPEQPTGPAAQPGQAPQDPGAPLAAEPQSEPSQPQLTREKVLEVLKSADPIFPESVAIDVVQQSIAMTTCNDLESQLIQEALAPVLASSGYRIREEKARNEIECLKRLLAKYPDHEAAKKGPGAGQIMFGSSRWKLAPSGKLVVAKEPRIQTRPGCFENNDVIGVCLFLPQRSAWRGQVVLLRPSNIDNKSYNVLLHVADKYFNENLLRFKRKDVEYLHAKGAEHSCRLVDGSEKNPIANRYKVLYNAHITHSIIENSVTDPENFILYFTGLQTSAEFQNELSQTLSSSDFISEQAAPTGPAEKGSVPLAVQNKTLLSFLRYVRSKLERASEKTPNFNWSLVQFETRAVCN